MGIATTDTHQTRLYTKEFLVSGGNDTDTSQISDYLLGLNVKDFSFTIYAESLDAPVQLSLKEGNIEDVTKMGTLNSGSDAPIILTINNGSYSHEATIESVYLGLDFDILTATAGKITVYVLL
jgi:hypothetical protein